MKPRLLIGNPSSNRGLQNVSAQLVAHSSPHRETIHAEHISSIVTFSFNQLWAMALNERANGLTHFLLWHADLKPLGQDWLDTMFDEMASNDADVLSAIVPIKDKKGVTSTAFDMLDGSWHAVRLTQKQALSSDIPDTWTADNLLFNSGLMLVDFRKPWVEQICFTINDRLERDPSGLWKAYVESEDWNFSRQCRKLGVRAFVTRRIVTEHYGNTAFRSDEPWGAEVDPDAHIVEQRLAVIDAP